jgi:hypothetical protein
MNVIVTWMYCSPPGENILHTQVGKLSGTRRVQEYYWRCAFLLFESSTRKNQDSRHLLFINQDPPATIDGVETAALIRDFNIELVRFPSITKSPADYFGSWNTQFIVIDVLEWLDGNVRPGDAVLILDSDVIFNRGIDHAFTECLRESRALLYSIDYPPGRSINGLTLAELGMIASEINPALADAPFVYSGGEFVCCLGSEVSRIARLARQTYEACLGMHRLGKKKFNEEAHLLSCVYATLGYRTHTANRFIKRIWTDRSTYCNVEGTEGNLLLWHLPSEKKLGFVRMFRALRRQSGKFAVPAERHAVAYRLKPDLSSRVATFARTLAKRLLGRRATVS